MYRIAAASNGGKFVDQHFGQANQFFIYEVNDSSYKFIEVRSVKNISKNFNTDYDKFLSIVKYLSGCRIVLVSQIGQGAVNFLSKNGIQVFDVEESIDNAIKKLIKYYSRIDKLKKYCK